MVLISLDPKSRAPKQRQILDRFRTLIEEGSLRPGERLPSTRRLAGMLGIHRSTVATAYQELCSLGFVDLRPCARPCVRRRAKIAAAESRAPARASAWEANASAASANAAGLFRAMQRAPAPARKAPISFRTLDIDHRLYPFEAFRTCLLRATRREGAPLLGYGDPRGFSPLRETIARRLHAHQIDVSRDEILITNGAQQAIDLVFRMIASPGRSVAIESPSYGHALPLLALSGLRALQIPVRDEGLDLSVLEAKLRKEKPALLYTMPAFQNPTGVSTTQEHREQLIALCERHRVPVLEDAFEEEMKYFGKVALPIKSMDTKGLVVYCGTFSKVLFPGVRIGWIAAGRACIERLTAIRSFTDISSNTVLQAAMHEFCECGAYDRHVSRMHRVYRKRMSAAIRALREHVRPEWAGWQEPSGGYLIWLALRPARGRKRDWATLLAEQGVEAAAGDRFFLGKPPGDFIRLSISARDEAEIEEGVRRLARALEAAHRRATA